jgi:PAS domain S-box-containing protein
MVSTRSNVREVYSRLKEELDLDIRFQSGIYEQIYALQNSVFLLEFDYQGEVVYVNQLLARFLGYPPGELVGKSVGHIYGGGQRLPLSLVRSALNGEVWDGSIHVRGAKGQSFWLNMTITPIQSKHSNLSYKYICVGFDITNQKRQKENLLEMIRQEKHYVSELVESKKELEKKVDEKVNELKDSIRYSERIQQALMPTQDRLQKMMPGHFEVAMLYKPRDIVSGDFYWAGTHNHQSIFIVGDGTGHGIPGAFMSILGIGSLVKLVEERGITNPCSILNQLDLDLRGTLNQENPKDSTERVLQDSIEMVVLNIPESGNTVKLSSAMLDAVLVSDQGFEIFKGIRRPLGGTLYRPDLDFINETVTFEPGATLYLFSDGYHSQIGDKSRNFRQLGKKRFRELLQDVNELPTLDERISVLDYYLKQWSGITTSQTDDILVMAIRYNPAGTGYDTPQAKEKKKLFDIEKYRTEDDEWNLDDPGQLHSAI